MPVISLQIANQDTFDDEYRDAMNLSTDLTIDELKERLLRGTFIKNWQEISSLTIARVEDEKNVPFDLADKISKFPFDEYIFTVKIKRKAKAKKSGSGRANRRRTTRKTRR